MARNEQPATSPQQLQLFLQSRYLNIQQVADILGIPKSFIYRRTARGHGDPIPHYRIGSHLRFKPDDVQEWIESHRYEPELHSPAALVASQRENNLSRSTKPAVDALGLDEHGDPALLGHDPVVLVEIVVRAARGGEDLLGGGDAGVRRRCDDLLAFRGRPAHRRPSSSFTTPGGSIPRRSSSRRPRLRKS